MTIKEGEKCLLALAGGGGGVEGGDVFCWSAVERCTLRLSLWDVRRLAVDGLLLYSSSVYLNLVLTGLGGVYASNSIGK